MLPSAEAHFMSWMKITLESMSCRHAGPDAALRPFEDLNEDTSIKKQHASHSVEAIVALGSSDNVVDVGRPTTKP